MKTVIMICGNGSSGKNTTANILKEKYFNNAQICTLNKFISKISEETIENSSQEWVKYTKECFINNDTVIITACFGTVEARKKYLNLFDFPKNINFICLYLRTEPDKIIKYNKEHFNDYEVTSDIQNNLINVYNNINLLPKLEEFNYLNNKIIIVNNNNLEEVFNYFENEFKKDEY